VAFAHARSPAAARQSDQRRRRRNRRSRRPATPLRHLTGALGHQLRGSAAAWVPRGPRHGAGQTGRSAGGDRRRL